MTGALCGGQRRVRSYEKSVDAALVGGCGITLGAVLSDGGAALCALIYEGAKRRKTGAACLRRTVSGGIQGILREREIRFFSVRARGANPRRRPVVRQNALSAYGADLTVLSKTHCGCRSLPLKAAFVF